MFKYKITTLMLGLTLCLFSTQSIAMSTFGAHPAMTKDSTKYFMWGPEALQLLQAASIYSDREHNTTAHNKEYFPELHFDRYQKETNNEAFENGLKAYSANLKKAIEMAKKNDLIGAFTHLGGALHTVQDFASHSNYIELGEKDQKIIYEIFFDGRSPKDLPKSVMLTHYDPNEKIPGIPEGSDYAHDIKSKDYPHRGDVSKSTFKGKLGYQHAYDTGVIFSQKVLEIFMHSIPEKAYRQVTNAQIWNIFPPYATNCKVGDINKSDYTAMRSDNIVCEGKPVHVYKLETAREVGINNFKK